MKSLEIYRKLAQKRYDSLSQSEQKVVRLGGAAIACKNAMAEYKQLRQDENYQLMQSLFNDFLSKLETAISNL